MPSRLTLAAGVLGVASLAFVGVGGYAAFTSNANLDTSATAGTFILNANVGKTGEACASGNTQQSCLYFDADNYASNQGSLSGLANNQVTTTDGSNASLTWTAPNMAPGDEYWADIYLQDTGTLQGKVSEVTYTPPKGTPSALLQDMTVTVQELTGSNTWTNLPRVGGNNIDGSQVGAGNYAATGNYTFSTAVNNGNVPFLQPLDVTNGQATLSPGDEQSAEFRVIYTLSDSATNAAEGQTVSPTLNFVGTSLP
jgi:hypothetical protein